MADISTSSADALRSRVQAAIDLIRPAIQDDGGDVELLAVLEGGVVHVRFRGACQGCPSASMTLHMGIERVLRDQVPEITQVLAV